MKRLLLILILIFPILTLLFWVYHGDAIRPRKPSGETNQVLQTPGTNRSGSNAAGSTNTNEPTRRNSP